MPILGTEVPVHACPNSISTMSYASRTQKQSNLKADDTLVGPQA